MGKKRKRSPYFIVEIDESFSGNDVAIEGRERASSVDAPRKVYLYQSDARKVAVGFDFERALRFLSAELAIEYVNRNSICRSILPYVKIERFSGGGRRRRALPG